MKTALPLALLAFATPLSAQEPSTSNAASAADQFQLELPAAEPAPARAAEAPEAAAAPLTADMPIEQLLADRRGRAVLDRDMPGLSTDKNLAKFRKLSLRQLQPQSGGRLTDALLAKVEADLAAEK